jgi:hypothetical protein
MNPFVSPFSMARLTRVIGPSPINSGRPVAEPGCTERLRHESGVGRFSAEGGLHAA